MNLSQSPRPREIVKEYYLRTERIDYVDIFEHFKGIESIFLRIRERLLKKLIKKYTRVGLFLDLGCGAGVILRNLPPNSVGLDINRWVLERAKKYAPTANLVVGDAENLPFKQEAFSTVVCSEVLEHLEYPCNSVREIYRILEHSGTLIGSVPHHSFIWRLVESGHKILRYSLSRLHFLSSTCSYNAPFHKLYRQEKIHELLSIFDVLRDNSDFLKINIYFVAQKGIQS